VNKINGTLHCTGSNKQVIEALVNNGVEFLLIGGLAVSWYCLRQADDMDILVNPSPENSRKVYLSIISIGYPESFVETSFSKKGVLAHLKKYHYADILTPKETWPSYESLVSDAVEASIFNIPIKVPSVLNLIELKALAIKEAKESIEKHQNDIQLLKACGL
jgi:hypothetical protein